ncbi:glucokinase [Desulfovibrio psychrotolerans]|uniref:Glucokinase n=1 Tax=Desulfovibrio psychrotolerans TaxID=415242 RepID=A0A7J0BRW0_9BACT|nr:glucokinase [Desulfovibrio psychrotolerans]GFM35754.1 glucokinase [Desulfovibrio psychrotolerans]
MTQLSHRMERPPRTKKPARILAADIGGTNSRFAAYILESGTLRREDSVWLSTTNAESFAGLLDQLAKSSLPLTPQEADVIVLGVAGPVRERRRVTPPNIAWDIDLDLLPAAYGMQDALLVNDFLAQAYACVSPALHAARTVLPGNAVPGAPVAVMGAGTGFGHALLLETAPGHFRAVPSEGGHAHFPFVGKEEFAFADFLREETGRRQVVGDMVITGSGIRNLHTFLTGERLTSREVTAKIKPDSPVLEWFARLFGRACHDFVLQTLAFGGLVLTGGVAAGTPDVALHPAFAEEFTASDTHGALLKNVPVRLNTDEEFGLWGAAQLGAFALQGKDMRLP